MANKNAGKTDPSTAIDKKKRSSSELTPLPTATVTVATPGTATEGLASESSTKKTGWTFLTNHSHVIILLARQPDMVLREVASEIGITERAVQRIIADLEEDGFLIREKIGRQNHYRVVRDLPLRHPIEGHKFIGDLVDLILLRNK